MLDIPETLQARLAWCQKHFPNHDHPLFLGLKTLVLVSDYACRHTSILKELLEESLQEVLTFDNYVALLQQLPHSPLPSFNKALRQFRHRYLLRLLLREYAGLSNTQESMASWSDCADALILRTLTYAEETLKVRYGNPLEESGGLASLYVLAMGKLGGRELNYSSDIDLIIAYSAQGQTEGPEVIDNRQYYTKVVQLFIQLMQNITEDGFVFRVDLRLRPNGESGSLVTSLDEMETYYQEQGRDWERYAMVKARLVSDSRVNAHPWFQRLITPFVYRRYVDFSVIESLRSMKSMIEREIKLNPRLDDIKRGLGSIREVEFIIQTIQLIRGGRLPSLKCQNALLALDAIGKEKLLPRVTSLKKAYLFLRKLENCLQSENDQQTHSLPEVPEKQAKIAYAMGYVSWSLLMDRLQQFRRVISGVFHAILRSSDFYQDENKLLLNQLTSLWQGHVEPNMAVNVLASLGYEAPDRCYQLIHAFRHSPRCRRLTQASRMRLDRLMVLLLNELGHQADTESVLLHVFHLLDNIVGRSAYLALLTENPASVKELIFWFKESPFISDLLVSYPFLLDQLLVQSTWKPLSRAELRLSLSEQLSHCEDHESLEDTLRQFKLINLLLIARAEMHGKVNSLRAARFLSDLAEVILVEVVASSFEQLAEKYPDILDIKSQFAIIAYGKLGSREMNYPSDLDLVFLHTSGLNEEKLVTRLTQKILHMLTTRSQFGVLYSVDTRLRPSGGAGLIVTELTAFVDYQKTQAWTWEHQALIRSRLLLGSARIRSAFHQLKQAVLMTVRDKSSIALDVKGMREKMLRHNEDEEIKFAPGGLIDLEFLVQFLVLVNPILSISRYTNTSSLMQQLASEDVLDVSRLHVLMAAYKAYHRGLHLAVLRTNHKVDLDNVRKSVLEVMSEMY